MHRPILWTALITPMLDDSSIDWNSLGLLLKRQANAGNGIVLLGSTGEGLALSLNERQEVIRFACSQKLSTPLMAGVGGFNQKETLEWLSFCEEYPLDAYLMVTPLYAKPGPVGQTQWFETLMNHVKKPCMLYNVPSRAGTVFAHEVVVNLKNHQNFWAIKEASGSLQEFARYHDEAAGQVELYSGDDALTPFFCSLGAKGLVSVAGNIWPKATQKFVQNSLSGNHQHLFPLWNQISEALFEVSNPIPTKALLCEKKLITSPTLRAPLTIEELPSMEKLKLADQGIQQWNK